MLVLDFCVLYVWVFVEVEWFKVSCEKCVVGEGWFVGFESGVVDYVDGFVEGVGVGFGCVEFVDFDVRNVWGGGVEYFEVMIGCGGGCGGYGYVVECDFGICCIEIVDVDVSDVVGEIFDVYVG